MKVLMINGSPHPEGCTYTALLEVAKTLAQLEVDSEIVYIGNKPVRGCIACHKCDTLKRCVFDDDSCNGLLEQARQADGLIVGSPVYYAGPNGALCALLDRLFFSGAPSLRGKPSAAVVSCRRGGASAAFDRLNKYFTLNQMPVVTSQYWNSVHGNTPEQVRQDLEGLQVMRTLGRNMAWLLHSLDGANLPPPEQEPRIATNFIR